MSVVVFLGPTLSLSEARGIARCEFECRPPARRGDIYRAVKHGARTIGLIDGYFRSFPSVSHKEILWSLAAGCHILGSSSMGALRAAELSAFGMVGVGRIFQDFLQGKLSRDDEVAVEHAPPELGYFATSEALVNMRYTLAMAIEGAHASNRFRTAFLKAACEMRYPDRTYERVFEGLEAARELGQEDHESCRWVLRNKVNQKAEDATDLLQALSEPAPPRRRFDFEDTYHFAQFRAFEDNPLIRHLA